MIDDLHPSMQARTAHPGLDGFIEVVVAIFYTFCCELPFVGLSVATWWNGLFCLFYLIEWGLHRPWVLTYTLQYQKHQMHISGVTPLDLTHWGRVMHIYVVNLMIIGHNNNLLPGRRQAIIWTNSMILLIGPWGTNVSDILISIHTFWLKK